MLQHAGPILKGVPKRSLHDLRRKDRQSQPPLFISNLIEHLRWFGGGAFSQSCQNIVPKRMDDIGCSHRVSHSRFLKWIYKPGHFAISQRTDGAHLRNLSKELGVRCNKKLLAQRRNSGTFRLSCGISRFWIEDRQSGLLYAFSDSFPDLRYSDIAVRISLPEK